MRVLIILFITYFFFHVASAQNYRVVSVSIVGKDTLPLAYIKEVLIISKRNFLNAKEERRYNKLRRDILIVYPYVQIASKTLKEINKNLKLIDNKKKKKRYLKATHKVLKEKFKKPLRNLTITQGKLLVKLIEREAGKNCYYLIKELKNPLSAFYWQTVGGFLGYDLKAEYNPGIDRDIENIVRHLDAVR